MRLVPNLKVEKHFKKNDSQKNTYRLEQLLITKKKKKINNKRRKNARKSF